MRGNDFESNHLSVMCWVIMCACAQYWLVDVPSAATAVIYRTQRVALLPLQTVWGTTDIIARPYF